MKKFIKLLLIFSAPILFLIIGGELLLRKIPNDYTYKKKYLDNNSDKVEVLFLGNSHIHYGINPEYSKLNTFNAAHISQSLKYDNAIYEKYKMRFKELKYVVISMDYLSLSWKLENSIENWRIKNYAIYYDMATTKPINKFEILNGKFSSNFLRLKYYLTGKSDISCNNLGYGINYHSSQAQDLIITGRDAAIRHTETTEAQTGENENIQAISHLIEASRKNNFKLLFITTPAYKSYTSSINKKQLDNSLSFIQNIVVNNSNVKFYNFLNDSSFIEKDFYDGDHLNEIGSKKLTTKINYILDELELTNTPKTK